MPQISGIRSYEGLRKRASNVDFGGSILLVASLADIIKSKKAAGRPQDVAVLPVLEEALEAFSSNPERTTGSAKKRE